MTTVTGTSTSLDESFILNSTGDYRGGQGADTYILTNQIPASAIITITDKEDFNKIQLADGLVIASSKFLSNAAELTLSNGAIVRILGASSFTFDIGANTTTGDVATNPNSTYAQFANELGAQVGSTTGKPNYRVPITIPTFSIVAGDAFSTIAAGNVSGFSASGVSEGSNATFTVKLSVAQTTATAVNYNLSGKGTTTIGTDTGTVAVQGTGVTATGGILKFDAGYTTATISVPVTFDTIPESGEGIILTLSSPSSGVSLGSDFIASKDFLDSTAPRFSMNSSAVSGSTLEGSAITFTITPDPLDPVLTTDITLSLDLVGDVKNGRVPADSADFYITAPEVIFNAGNSLPKTITVNVANDITMEGVQYYTAVLVDTKTGIQKAIPIDGTINDSANVTGPVFIGAEMDTAGTSIDLIYNQALGKAATETTSPFAFVIKVGTNIVTPSSVTVVGSRVKLNLADAITKGINDVTIDYLSPTASALTSNPAIQDILGNDAFPIVKFPVKNNSIVDSLASTLTLAMDSNFNGSTTASTVSLKANSPIYTIFNATGAPGIKQIIIDGTKAEVTVNNLATLATVQLNNQPFGNLSVAYALTSPVVTSTSTSDVQRLTVSNVGSTDSVAVAIDKVESLILVSTNYPNKVGLSGVTAATTIAVEGDKALTITTVPLLLNNFNAASATASINANLSAATKLLSVQGGAGADTITVDATKLDPNALISGNGSADTLFINSGATETPLQPRMSTVETLKIGAITRDLVFKGDKTTDLTNLSLASTLGANVNLENLTTSNFTVDTNGVTAAKTVTVTNIGTETLNYIAESTSFDNNDAIFNFSNASALIVNVGKNVVQKGAITANKAVSITLSVTSSKTSENPTELTSFKGSLNSLTASSLNVNATGTLVPGSETLDLTTSALPKLKTLTITGGGSVSMKAAQYNLLETITAAGTDTIILSDIGDVTAKAGIEKYDLGSIGSIGRKITIPSEVVAAVTIKGGTGADTITLGALVSTITVDDSTVAVTGGAGADNVTFLNTLALADTLSFDGGIGTDSVVLPAFANTITLTNVETITATAGLTTQTITVAGASAVALAAGAGVQNILSTNTALTTITDAATTTSIVTGIATGTGGYSINTGVLNSAINFSAMTGIAPMTIALNAGGPTAVTITEATATNTGTTTLTGGATTQTVTVTGGATAHTFTSTALSNINYTAVTAVTAQAITTGAGNDIIAGGGGADSITVGNGTNSVIVANKADLALLVTLVGGTGVDTLTITAPTTPIVDTDFSKTAAFDTLVLGAATTATLDTLFKTTAGFTSITGSGGIDALTFAGVAPVVSINGGVGADTITVTSTLGSTLTIADTDGISVTGGTGVDAITFITSITATTVTGGVGADVITLGNFTNTLSINDATIAVTGGTGIDTINFITTALTAVTVTGDTGADVITLGNFTNALSINDATIAVTGGTGIDTINFITTALTAVTVTGDTGADVITLGNFTNALSINDSTVLVTGNAGADTITLTNTAALTAVTIDGATGADSLAAIGNFANNTATFTDMDSVTLSAITADSTTGAFTIAGTTATTVTAPAGNSIFASTSTATTTITATATKTLALSGTGAFAVSGMTSGAITSTGSGPLTVTGGAAATTVTSASATTVTQGAGQTLALAGTGTFSVSGGTTGTITSTGSGQLTVTSSANAQRVTSASATTVNATSLNTALTIGTGSTGNFTVTGLGNAANSSITETGTPSGTLTVTTAGNNSNAILEAGGTGAVIINVVGAGLTTLTGLSAHTSHTATMGAGTSLTVDPASTALSYGVTMTGNSTHAYVGDTNTSAVDTIDASAATGTTAITGGLGNDIIKLGAATDTVIFTAVATNGADTITDFTVGAGGDVLKVTALATLIGTGGAGGIAATNGIYVGAVSTAKGDTAVSKVAVIGAADNAAADWSTVLAKIGGALTVAGDTTAANAATTVLISNGTDVRVYLFSDDATSNTTVEAGELTLVGTITGITAANLVEANFSIA